MSNIIMDMVNGFGTFPTVNILGRQIDLSSGDLIKEILSSFIWVTYRYDFAPLPGTSLTSDAGWGCMIRCGQMLAASALMRLSLVFPGIGGHELERQNIISFFLDSPDAPLSLSNIASAGERSYERKIGEWHAPSITARSIGDLININQELLGLQSYCATDVTIEIKDVTAMMQQSNGCGLLLWIPMRLGVDSLNGSYSECVKDLLKAPYSLGIAGGRPNSALYFVGFVGDDLIYLDPHYNRLTITDATLAEVIPVSLIFTMQNLQSYACQDLRRVYIQNIDPCLVAGFLIPDLEALEAWQTAIDNIKTSEGSTLITMQTIKQPDFSSAVAIDIDEDLVEIDFEAL